MNKTPKVVGLPNSEEERARRLRQEVERLASLPIVEWQFYLETGELAKKHGIEAAKLTQMVEATIHANEKKAREAKADDRREKQKAERRQERENRLSRQEQERARPCVPAKRLNASNASRRPGGKSAMRHLLRLPSFRN